MSHEHYKHLRDFHQNDKDQVRLQDQERKDARDDMLDQLQDDNDAANELAEFNKKKAEQQKLQNDLFFEMVKDGIIHDDMVMYANQLMEAKRQATEMAMRQTPRADQPQVEGTTVIHFTDRNSMLDNFKADVMLVSGVSLHVIEQLFNIFKNSQDELVREKMVFKKPHSSTKSDVLIELPSHDMAFKFLSFLSEIQKGMVPVGHHARDCNPYLGLTLIAQLGQAIAKDPSLLADILNPFKMRLNFNNNY